MSIPDALICRYFRLLSTLGPDEIKDKQSKMDSGENPKHFKGNPKQPETKPMTALDLLGWEDRCSSWFDHGARDPCSGRSSRRRAGRSESAFYTLYKTLSETM